mmetsp:Transcript_43224/g.85236  ORF Transcript_43224/g.85236 Transcript_43224/m.85236 type:complete len:84 (-) Transcript_43224:1069-1320(-)
MTEHKTAGRLRVKRNVFRQICMYLSNLIDCMVVLNLNSSCTKKEDQAQNKDRGFLFSPSSVAREGWRRVSLGLSPGSVSSLPS